VGERGEGGEMRGKGVEGGGRGGGGGGTAKFDHFSKGFIFNKYVG